MDRVLNISKLTVLIAEALPGQVSVPLQFFQRRADGIHAVLADEGQTFGGVVPVIRQ